MHPEAMVATLKSLKLFGMAQAIDDLAQQGSPAWQGAESVLDSLLKAEVAEREVRSINYQTKAARFPPLVTSPASTSTRVPPTRPWYGRCIVGTSSMRRITWC